MRELSKPICRALRFAFNLRRTNTTKDVPWDGPGSIPSMRGGLPDIQYQLTLEGLRRARESCEADTLESIVIIAIQLGMEQGRRAEAKDGRTRFEAEFVDDGTCPVPDRCSICSAGECAERGLSAGRGAIGSPSVADRVQGDRIGRAALAGWGFTGLRPPHSDTDRGAVWVQPPGKDWWVAHKGSRKGWLKEALDAAEVPE